MRQGHQRELAEGAWYVGMSDAPADVGPTAFDVKETDDMDDDLYLATVITQLKGMQEDLKQYNEGARMADDKFCQLCGARGVWGRYCSYCAEGLEG